MASIASVDRSLSRASSWMSYAAFLGLAALAFLPARTEPPKATASRTAIPAGSAGAVLEKALKEAVARPAAPPAAPVVASAPPAASSAPAASGSAVPGAAAPGTATPAAATPPPDVWTPEELAAGLRKCVQLLSPAAANIALEEPMKHGQCGTPAPLVLHSIGTSEKVEFSPAPTMNCRLAASLAEWVEKVLQPAAQQALGSRIKRIVGSSSYSCRNIYNNPKLTLSEHATGNAIDIAGFVTADGRTISVAKSWGPTGRDIEAAKKRAADKAALAKAGAESKETPAAAPVPSIEVAGKKADPKDKGKLVKTNFKREEAKAAAAAATAAAAETQIPVPATTKEAGFLKRLHGSSCTVFATVLGPEANDAHRDHFHLDMKVRASGASVCH